MKLFPFHIYFYILVSLLIINESIYLALGLFSVDELKPAKYEIDILQTPVKFEERNSPVMYMTSKYGQQYQCLLPQQELIQPNSENKDAPSDGSVDVKELLQPLQNAQCLLKTMDWWTYEFCFNHFIKQYHVEDGKIVGPVITLGLYHSDYDWNNETNKEKMSSQLKRYHSQYYVNGTKCDLTNLPRSAEVRFFCEEDAGDYIYRVDEPGTCSYILTVHTSRICSHPLLKPVPSNKPHVISCSPLLTEEQYQQYLDKMEEEKRVAEIKRKEWLAEQQERLKKLKGWAQEQWQKLEKDDKVEETEPDEATVTEEPSSEELPVKESMTLKKSDSVMKEGTSDDTSEDQQNSNVADSLDQEILKEFEKELVDISQEQRSKLATYKDDLHHQISQQFNAILNEAEEELQQELNDETKDAAFSKLASTLNLLLEKLDKAEKDVAMATKELEKAKSVIVNKKSSVKSSSVNGEEENGSSHILNDEEDEEEEEGEDEDEDDLLAVNDEQNDIASSEDNEALKDKQDQKPAAVLDDGKVHVRIRRLGRRSRNLDGRLQELDMSQRQKLEQAVKEKLEKAGLDTGGRRIEVKIITAGYYDNEDGKDFHALSDEETQQFQTMIMTLLTGNQEAIQEMERHKKLEKNYNFVWGEDGFEKDEEE